MELGLQFEDVSYFESLESHAVTHEETMETAIPEYCPDMSRIVDAVGELYVQEKLPAEDRYTVAGMVKVTVLYTSEEAPGLRSLAVSVPFSSRLEDRIAPGSKLVCVTGRVLMLEAKAVTSRRLYIRLMPELTAYTFRQQQFSLCTGTEAEPTLRVRREEITLPLLAGVAEQEISFTDETMLPNGKMPEDLLIFHMCPSVQSTQRVGSKLMVKGELGIRALYRAEGGQVEYWEAARPYSDIVDGSDLPEDGTYVLAPSLADGDMRLLRNDSDGGFGITAQIRFCIRAYQRRTVSYISDLYSIRSATEIQQKPVTVHLDEPERELTEEAVTRLDLDDGVPFVYVTQLDCTPVTSTVDGGRPVLRTAVHIQLLYLDDSGSPVTTGRTEEVTAAVDEVKGTASAVCCQAAVQCGNACQIRVPVTFFVGSEERLTLNTMTGVTMTPEAKGERAPSLVLRRMQPGETLWDVAKQYRTDADAIRQANQMEGETTDKMLLIPKVR